MHCGLCLELLGVCPPFGQFNGVHWKWLRSFAPPTSRGGGWRRILSLFDMPIVLAVAVSSRNLVPLVGTMAMKCKIGDQSDFFQRIATPKVTCCTYCRQLKLSAEVCSYMNKDYWIFSRLRIFKILPFIHKGQLLWTSCQTWLSVSLRWRALLAWTPLILLMVASSSKSYWPSPGLRS